MYSSIQEFNYVKQLEDVAKKAKGMEPIKIEVDPVKEPEIMKGDVEWLLTN